jgi:hypothetical protein
MQKTGLPYQGHLRLRRATTSHDAIGEDVRPRLKELLSHG